MKTVTLRLGEMTFSDTCERIPSASVVADARAEASAIQRRADEIGKIGRNVVGKACLARRDLCGYRLAQEPGRLAQSLADEADVAVAVFEAGGSLYGRTSDLVEVA